MDGNKMGDYFGNKKQMKFKSIDSLKPIGEVIAEKALNDKSRKIQDSPIRELLLGAAVTNTLTAAGGLAITGGLIGGGMAVLGAPAIAIGAAVTGVATAVKNKKLRSAKELIYKDAIAKQTDILKALQKEVNADKERIEYLTRLNILLQEAIKDLQHDRDIDS